MRKGWKRVHRLVVLPDYQGIGIGVRFINEVSKYYIKKGFNMNLTTTTPALVHALARAKEWILIRKSRMKAGLNEFFKNNPNKTSGKWTFAESKNRITYSFNFKK
jgi:GNAT superfamily N-acetyltransferase